jgi:hypothetical protein
MPLPQAPASVLEGDRPRFGAYEGTIPSIDLAPLVPGALRGRLARLTRLKRWQYAMITTDEVLIAVAIADLGYASNAFAFAVDRSGVLVDRTFLGLPRLSAHINTHPGQGARARFSAPGVRIAFHDDGDHGGLALHTAGFELVARFGAPSAPPLTLVAPVDHGIVNVTRKAALLPAEGSLTVGSRRFDLAGGHVGLDWTHGILARETAWRWAFLAGKDAAGVPIAANFCAGFTAGPAREDVAWGPGRLEALPAVAFAFDPADTRAPWRLHSDDGAVDLAFTAIGEHREHRDLVVASSRFVQVAGRFSGRLTIGGAVRELDGVPGVTEDQRVRW